MIEDILVSASDLSRLFEVTQRTIWKWAERGLTKERRGKFPLLKAFRWWRLNILGDLQGESNLAIQKLRYATARACMEEFEVAQREGRLIDKDIPTRWLVGLATEVKNSFLGLPRRMAEVLASEGDPKQIEFLLSKEIRQILCTLAETGKN
jgi:phage terminase Nu1 subunit (DNA packaging protein)